MKILWLTWKDSQHPLAGGAEVVAAELAKRLSAAGHDLLFITGGFKNAQPEVTHAHGYRILRLGNRYSVYWQAYRYIRKSGLDSWPDLVIEEVNTMPFLSQWYLDKPRVLLVHQLCREIWFHELPLPLSLVGFCLEPMYLRALNKQHVVTVSASTRRDLTRHGFDPKFIDIISEGLHIEPLANLDSAKKYHQPTMLSLGGLRSMKRTLHQLQAFELAKKSLPNLQLKIAGAATGRYGQRVLERIKRSRYAADIQYLGKVTHAHKKQLMRRCHVIVVTSVKEGWGLIVTEAASQGTPAVVYDVDGLRDSVRHEQTGLVTTPKPRALADGIVQLLQDDARYQTLRAQGWRWSKTITFDQAYQDFRKAVLT